ncbi:MAG: RNA 2',3'-cyclic phosphodiesterase [Acidobacteria bacterium]|nr:RNA 2',3'-cyclic phosphodiesterase [Acidobacteriota bacterium]
MRSTGLTRTFVCVELPASIRAQAEELQGRLAGLGETICWVNPTNLHLTLRFLGEISRSQVETVCLAVRCAAASVDAFSIRLSGTGCFPSPRRPKAFWIGVTDASNLIRLFEGVEEQLFIAGFPREARPFSPHLTLGRVRVDRNRGKLGEVLAEAEFDAASFLATEVTVMKSDLRSSGAVYMPIAKVRLRTRELLRTE